MKEKINVYPVAVAEDGSNLYIRDIVEVTCFNKHGRIIVIYSDEVIGGDGTTPKLAKETPSGTSWVKVRV